MQLSNFSTSSLEPRPSLAPLVEFGTYYRTRTFQTELSLNPLLAASAPLLSLLSKINGTSLNGDPETLKQQLLQELKTFEYQASQHQYPTETILLARYILCTVLDDMIIYSDWTHHEAWREHKLLLQLQNQDNGDERFFVMLDNLMSDPKRHLDLLELLYICLSLGYRGIYRNPERDHHELDTTVEKLYQCIRSLNGDFDKRLSDLPPPPSAKKVKPFLPLWASVVFSISLVLAVYFGFNYLFVQSAKPAYQQINSILNTTPPLK